jgi:MFS family permease
MRTDQFGNNEERMMLNKAMRPRYLYGYVVVAAGFMIWLIGWGGQSTFGVFFKPMLTEFGWNRAETALAMSLLTIVQATLAIATGWLTDKLGPRIVVTVFGSFWGICYLLMSQINALWQFQVNYALVAAIGLSVVSVPVMATVARWFVERRGLMIGIVQAGAGIGGLILAPLTGWLILNHGWRYSYMFLGIIILACMIISGLLLRRAPEDAARLPGGANEVTSSGAKEQSPNLLESGLSLGEAIRTVQFWMITGIYFSFGFCRSSFLVHVAAYVQDLGFSLADGANVLAALAGASTVGRIGMGRVADMIGNKRTLLISFAAMAAALGWGLVTTDLWGLYLFALVFGFSWGAQAVLRFAIASETFGLLSVGVIMASLGLAEAGAASFGSYFAGYTFDTIGNYDLAFFVGIAISIVGIFLAFTLKPVKGNN